MLRMRNRRTVEMIYAEMKVRNEKQREVQRLKKIFWLKLFFLEFFKPSLSDKLEIKIPYFCPKCHEELDEFDIYKNNLEFCNNCNRDI